MIEQLILEMIALNGTDTRRIAHALKVYGFARCIAGCEQADAAIQQRVEAAAVLHDIAIRHCEAVYGSCAGHLQEKEGPGIARPLLERHTQDAALVERVLYIIGHHHSYSHIDGLDYQIVVEADFLVNVQEGDITPNAFAAACRKLFRTGTGRRLAQTMFP